MGGHAKREPIVSLLKVLHKKFAANLEVLDNKVIAHLETVDLYSRAIDGLREELKNSHCGDDAQKLECSQLLEEIFADVSQAMYLLSLGLVVPARMLVRRAFELGLASVYLWDLPHEYWGWSKHDDDLSFSKMVDHLSSSRYHTHVCKVSKVDSLTWPCSPESLQKTYHLLSNTVHGKSDGLPPLSPNRYSSAVENVGEHLKLLTDVQRTLLDIWCVRFPGIREFLHREFPAALKV